MKLGLPETNQSMESAFHVNVEDVLEDVDIELRHEEVEREEVGSEQGIDDDLNGQHEGAASEELELDGPSAKTVKSDNIRIPVQLWTNRIAKKLKEY